MLLFAQQNLGSTGPAGSQTEVASAVDTLIASLIAAVSTIETGSASDNQSVSATFSVTVTEQTTSSDSGTGLMSSSASLSESATATETTTGLALIPVAIVEQTTATSVETNTLLAASVVSEPVSASSVESSTFAATVSILESVTASSVESESLSATTTITESVTATDSSSVAAFTASATESATSSDTLSATVVASCSIAEANAATDTQTTSVSTSIAESTSANDALTSTITATLAVQESAAASDISSGSQSVSTTESANVTDTPTAQVASTTTMSEAASLTSEESSTAVMVSSVSENTGAVEAPDGLTSMSNSVQEVGIASEAASYDMPTVITISEAAFVLDNVSVITLQQIQEAQSASDTQTATGTFFSDQTETVSADETSAPFTPPLEVAVTESADTTEYAQQTVTQNQAVFEFGLSADTLFVDMFAFVERSESTNSIDFVSMFSGAYDVATEETISAFDDTDYTLIEPVDVEIIEESSAISSQVGSSNYVAPVTFKTAHNPWRMEKYYKRKEDEPNVIKVSMSFKQLKWQHEFEEPEHKKENKISVKFKRTERTDDSKISITAEINTSLTLVQPSIKPTFVVHLKET